MQGDQVGEGVMRGTNGEEVGNLGTGFRPWEWGLASLLAKNSRGTM